MAEFASAAAASVLVWLGGPKFDDPASEPEMGAKGVGGSDGGALGASRFGGPKFDDPAFAPEGGANGVGGSDSGALGTSGLGGPRFEAMAFFADAWGAARGEMGPGRFAPVRTGLGNAGTALGAMGGATTTVRSDSGLGVKGLITTSGLRATSAAAAGAVTVAPQLGQGPVTPPISRGIRKVVWQLEQAKLISKGAFESFGWRDIVGELKDRLFSNLP